MEQNLKEVARLVVDEVLNQYIGQLKSHYEKSNIAYPEELASTNAVVRSKRDNDVVKCGKGIRYAENIRANLDDIMSHKKYWSRKQLIARYHNGKDEYPNSNIKGELSSKEVAFNCYTALDSMGVPLNKIVAGLVGYCYFRMSNEVFQEQAFPYQDVTSASFGRLQVNYGKPVDFDVLGGKEGVEFTIDFEKFYSAIRHYVVQVLNGCPCSNGNTYDGAFKELSSALHFGGTYCLMTDTNKIKPYQIIFREIVRYKASENGLDDGLDKVS